jgi:hypothetical protein
MTYSTGLATFGYARRSNLYLSVLVTLFHCSWPHCISRTISYCLGRWLWLLSEIVAHLPTPMLFSHSVPRNNFNLEQEYRWSWCSTRCATFTRPDSFTSSARGRNSIFGCKNLAQRPHPPPHPNRLSKFPLLTLMFALCCEIRCSWCHQWAIPSL